MILFLLMLATALTDDQVLDRMIMGEVARTHLISFARLTSPAPTAPLDCRQSRYEVAPHLEYTGGKLEQLSRREFLRLRVDMPYRHGKTELGVRKFVPWLLGNFPYDDGLVITHTGTLADEHGRDVRDVMQGAGYRLVFGHDPATRLRTDSQAMDRLQTEGGGTVMFMGRDRMGGGIGAKWIIIDDLIKNEIEARSPTIRDKAWRTYHSDCLSRLDDDRGWLLLIGTRRHADDPAGRLFDPRNPHYDEREARRFVVVKLPALSLGADVDQLGRKKDEALWPARRSFAFWNSLRTSPDEMVREDFETQAQGNPHPAAGRFFKRHWWTGALPDGRPDGHKTTYASESELPKRLRIYCASDHAVTEAQRNDATVLLPFGMDEQKHIWILPGAVSFRYESPDIVEAMLAIMRKYQPLRWWAEREHISKSILPFLRLKQLEAGVFGHIEESAAVAHPEIRAWSIRGMLAAGRVHFPSFADWWSEAEAQLVEFPGGPHDDWVSALSHAGMGVDQVLAAEGPGVVTRPEPGTLAWVKQSSKRAEERKKGTGGW